MAGYRPKSLDELNSMYDKTIEAEKAIIKGTSLLRKNEEYTDFSSDGADIDNITREVRESVGVSDAVSEFIAKYSTLEALPGMENEDTRPKPENVVFSQEPVKEEKSFEIASDEAEAPVRKEKEPVDRDELMNEYMRIMNDEGDDDDDELYGKKLSRKEKKKLKKQEKLDAMSKKEEPEEEVLTEAGEPVEQIAPEAEEATEEYNEEPTVDEASLLEKYEEEYGFNTAEAEEASYNEEATDEFEFPEDYTPQWMEPSQDEEITEEVKEKKPAYIIIKAALGVVLALLILIGGASTVLKTVLAVNTGKIFNDNYYAFTAERDYADTGILKGDLVITEKRYAEKDEIFVFVDFNEKSFEFAKHSDSITSIDGSVLIVAEKDGGRALISRDDTKGVVHKVYPSVGSLVRFVTDNYIVIIAVISVLSLIIVLTLALAFKGKGKNNRDAEEAVSESNEAEEEDLFSNIE